MMTDPRQNEQHSGPETIDAGDRGIYLYGIGQRIPGDDTAVLDQLGRDAGLLAIEAGDLLAFVKEVPLSKFSEEALRERVHDEAWLMSAAQAHHHTVARIYQQVPILPAKFGSIYESEAALRDALNDSRQQLAERLNVIDGCDEWAVHVFRRGDSLREETLTLDPKLRRMNDELEQSSEGRAYMLRRQFQTRLERAVEEHEMSVTRSLLSELQRWTAALQLEETGHATESVDSEPEVTRASVLVRREHAQAFMDAADRIANAREGLRIEISGPWPAYSFAQMESKV